MFRLLIITVTLLIYTGFEANSTEFREFKVNENNKRFEIHSLIEQLAVSKGEANGDEIKESKIKMASLATNKLTALGKDAFAILSEYLEDNRHGVAFRAAIYNTVGDACFDIITSQLYNFPSNYPGSRLRIGADGKSHYRPFFGKISLFSKKTLPSWLNKRQRKSIRQLQIEVLQYVIKQEEEIGFQNKADEDFFLKPLLKHLSYLSANGER